MGGADGAIEGAQEEGGVFGGEALERIFDRDQAGREGGGVGEQGQAAGEQGAAAQGQAGARAEADAFARLGRLGRGPPAGQAEAEAQAPGHEGERGQIGRQRRIARHDRDGRAAPGQVFVENTKDAARDVRPAEEGPEHGRRVADERDARAAQAQGEGLGEHASLGLDARGGGLEGGRGGGGGAHGPTERTSRRIMGPPSPR